MKICNISLRFIVHIILHGYGLQYNTSKRVKEEILLGFTGGRPVSMQNLRFIVHIVYLFLHGCGLYYNVLSGLSVVKELTSGLRCHSVTHPTAPCV